MSKETYIFQKQVHLGKLKFSLMKGSKFEYEKTSKGNFVYINGEKTEDTSEIDLCIRTGFAIPYVEGETEINNDIKVSPKALEKSNQKMKVRKSDEDEMTDGIDISYTKNSVIKAEKEKKRAENNLNVIHEKDEKTIRGMRIVNNDAEREADGINVPLKKSAPKPKEISGMEDIASIVNDGDAKVVKKIDEDSTVVKKTRQSKKLITKKSSDGVVSEAAKVRAEARKKAAQDGHDKKMQEELTKA